MKKTLFSFLLIATSLQAAPPDFDELREKTYGVHLTQFYPKDGRLMIPGSLFSLKRVSTGDRAVDACAGAAAAGGETGPASAPSESKEVLTFEQRCTLANHTPKYRFTLHWALSGVPEDHDFDTEGGETCRTERAQRPFAILEPFSHLLPESYGGTDQDWMTVGPHVLGSDSILFAACTHRGETRDFPGEVILFDPEAEKLDDLIPDFLRKRGAFVLKRDISVSEYATEARARETGYNEDNIPVTVNASDHYASPHEFFTALREEGYFWGKHHGTYFEKFESFLRPFFSRIILFQAEHLFPDALEGVAQTGFKCEFDPVSYVQGSIAAFPGFIQKTKLSPKTQKVFNCWLMELRIWVKYVCSKDKMTALKFLECETDPAGYMRQIVETVHQHSTQPMHQLLLDTEGEV